MRLSGRTITSFEIWNYPYRTVELEEPPAVLQFFGRDRSTPYVKYAYEGTSPVTFSFDYLYTNFAISDWKTMGVKHLRAIVGYRLVNYGTCRLFFKWGNDEMTIEDISMQQPGYQVNRVRSFPLDRWIKDDKLEICATLAGDGYTESEAWLDFLAFLIGFR